jgi:luciferase family oxidoreductase group 1
MDIQHFPQMVADLMGFIHGTLPEGHQLGAIKTQPGGPPETVPEVWLLGSSDYSARLASQLGLPFSFADFFGNTAEYGPKVCELYRQNFLPSEYLSEPKVGVGLQVVCAPTEEEAEFIGSSRAIAKVLRAMGLSTEGIIPPEEAVNWPLPDDAIAYQEEQTKSFIEGNPQQVEEGIMEAAERYQTGELAIVTNCYYFEHRTRSFEMVADIFRNSEPIESGIEQMAASD